MSRKFKICIGKEYGGQLYLSKRNVSPYNPSILERKKLIDGDIITGEEYDELSHVDVRYSGKYDYEDIDPTDLWKYIIEITPYEEILKKLLEWRTFDKCDGCPDDISWTDSTIYVWKEVFTYEEAKDIVCSDTEYTEQEYNENIEAFTSYHCGYQRYDNCDDCQEPQESDYIIITKEEYELLKELRNG